jgi:hypothetical protein
MGLCAAFQARPFPHRRFFVRNVGYPLPDSLEIIGGAH